MKKFFVMILLVSTFFIGLGALIDRADASLKSDANALELIRLARIAIGGDTNIVNVRSMTIAGNSTHFFDKDGAQQTEQGTLEINLQLPNQFSKTVRIGNPDNAGTGEDQRRVDVTIVQKDGGGVANSGDGEKDIIIIRKGDVDADWTSKDGADVKTDGDKKIIIKRDSGDPQVLNTEDGKRIIVDNDTKIENVSGARHNEMFRILFSLLLSAPEGLDVSYVFAGEESVDGDSCNIVLAQTGGSSFKLFLDRTTNLPRMISYEGMNHPHIIRFHNENQKDMPKEGVFEIKIDPASVKMVEHQIKFSEFRSVGGLLLPYRWTESAGGKSMQNIDITSYEINPPNIADKFKNQKVFVRRTKPSN